MPPKDFLFVRVTEITNIASAAQKLNNPVGCQVMPTHIVHSNLGMYALIFLAVLAGIQLARAVVHKFLPAMCWIRDPRNMRERVLQRYQGKDFHAWMFARFKTDLDAMFRLLPELLTSAPGRCRFLDLGCGFGIAGCFLLEHLPDAVVWAVDPNGSRVRAAAAAMGGRGQVFEAAAPDFERPEFPESFDVVLALDMLHFLSDQQLDLTLARLRDRLCQGGILLIRCPVQPDGPQPMELRFYKLLMLLSRTGAVFRTAEQLGRQITAAGFELQRVQVNGNKRQLQWFIATVSTMRDVVQVHGNGCGDHEEDDAGVNENQPPEMQAGELVPLLHKTQSA